VSSRVPNFTPRLIPPPLSLSLSLSLSLIPDFRHLTVLTLQPSRPKLPGGGHQSSRKIKSDGLHSISILKYVGYHFTKLTDGHFITHTVSSKKMRCSSLLRSALPPKKLKKYKQKKKKKKFCPFPPLSSDQVPFGFPDNLSPFYPSLFYPPSQTKQVFPLTTLSKKQKKNSGP
jgi:hypothetical protein